MREWIRAAPEWVVLACLVVVFVALIAVLPGAGSDGDGWIVALEWCLFFVAAAPILDRRRSRERRSVAGDVASWRAIRRSLRTAVRPEDRRLDPALLGEITLRLDHLAKARRQDPWVLAAAAVACALLGLTNGRFFWFAALFAVVVVLTLVGTAWSTSRLLRLQSDVLATT